MKVGGHYKSKWRSSTKKKLQMSGKALYSACVLHSTSTYWFFYLETAEFILNLCQSLELPSKKNWITNKNNNSGVLVVFSFSEIAYGIDELFPFHSFYKKYHPQSKICQKNLWTNNRASWLIQMLKPFLTPSKFHNAFVRYFHSNTKITAFAASVHSHLARRQRP